MLSVKEKIGKDKSLYDAQKYHKSEQVDIGLNLTQNEDFK
jgi:hypothetical protein